MEKKNLGMIKSSIGLKDAISSILESASLKVGVKEVCDKYLNKIDNGAPEELLYESFIDEMSKFSSLSSVEQQLNLLDYNAKNDKNNIAIKRAVYEMANTEDAVIGTMIESAVTDYLISKTEQSTKALRESLSLFEGRKNIDKILECVEFDEYQKKITGKSHVMELKESAIEQEPVMYTQEQMDKIVNNRVNEALENSKKTPKETRMGQLRDRLRLMESIDNILEKESRNKEVKAFCESYLNALHNGVSQYKLYESFISGLSQYTYLNAVDTELSAMKDRLSKYKQDIDLTKILEMMKETSSYYIVPLIEESVVNYCKNKNAATRVMARQALDSFSYDPFVKDILNIISSDRSLGNIYLGESVEMNRLAHTEKVYSPVLYIKENECVFNVDGTYYDKKGNNIIRVPKCDIVNLSESFKNTCNVINSSNTVYDELKGSFKVYSDGKNVGYVNESSIIVNDEEVKYEDISNPNYLQMCTYEGTRDFYDALCILYENFNTIAELDFVKSVHLNESKKIVDIFKLNKTIHMALVNEDNSTEFYKNVNPIKCKNLMNEHMNFNVDAIFEDVMPNQKRIEEDIEETKCAYEDYICNLKKRKEELESLKEGDDEINEEDLKNAIELIDKEIDNATKDYKQYQTDIEDEFKFGNGEEGEDKEDDKNDKEDNDDIKDVEVEVDKDEISEPLSNTNEEPDKLTPEDSEYITNTIHDMEDDSSDYDGLFDTPSVDNEGNMDAGFEVVKVSFDKNIKNGQVSNHGTVIMTIPMVTSNGDIRDEIKTVTFTLNSDKEPIINNDYMPATMYNAIKNAIIASPDITSVDFTATPEIPAEQGDVQGSEMKSTDDSSLQDTDILGVKTDRTDPIDSMNIETSDDIDDMTDEEPSLDTEKDSSVDLNSPIIPAKQETPAEVENVSFDRNSDEGYINVSFPIEVGISYDEILPIAGEDFEKDLHMHKIETKPAHDEEIGDGLIIILKNRADIEYMRKYLEEWLSVDRTGFFNAFPELKQFESFNYRKASKLNESIILEGSIEMNIDGVEDELEDLKSALDKENFKVEDEGDGITLIANNTMEFDDICSFLSEYSRGLDNDSDMSKELDKVLGDMDTDSTIVTLPYNAKLITALDKEGISYEEVDEDTVDIVITNEEDADFLIDQVEKLGIEETPSYSEFVDMMEDGGFVNEGLKITVEDTENHKKITFDTDDLEKKSDSDKSEDDSDEEEDKDTENADGDASFGDDTQLYSTPEEAEEAKKDGEDNKQEESCEPKKKKFVFKAKKLNNK